MLDLDYVKVTGRFGLTVGDGPDIDETPDTIWCDTGTVRFTPLNTYTKVAGGSPAPWTAGQGTIEADVNSDGYVTWLDRPYVWLVDLTSPKVNPVIGDGKATHEVEFVNLRAGGTQVRFPKVQVRLAADVAVGGVVDLTLAMPVPAAGGTPIIVGPQGVGVVAVVQEDPTSFALELTDGQVTDEVVLPVGPGGSDDGVAAYIETPGTATREALSAQTVTVAADAMGNPESPLNGATVEVVEGVLGGGVAGLMLEVDAYDAPATPRPSGWAGRVTWNIFTGNTVPLGVIDGDKVRRVTSTPIPWTPLDLPGLTLWVDAQALALANGAAVSSWPDLSPVGVPATQATSGNQPTFQTGVINGHPAVVGDGAGDHLIATRSALSNYAGPITVYAVAGSALADVPTSTTRFLYDAKDSAAVAQRAGLARNGTESFYSVRGTNFSSAASAWGTGHKILRQVLNGASSSVRDGDTQVAAGTVQSTPAVRDWSLLGRADGVAGNTFPGYLGELIVVLGTVSEGDDLKVMNYLRPRWSIV